MGFFFVWFLCDLNEHHIEIGQWDGGRNFSKNIYQQQKKKIGTRDNAWVIFNVFVTIIFGCCWYGVYVWWFGEGVLALFLGEWVELVGGVVGKGVPEAP